LLDDVRHAPTEYHDGRTVAKTFGLAIEEAAKLHPAAEPLVHAGGDEARDTLRQVLIAALVAVWGCSGPNTFSLNGGAPTL
jgi:hypothetical protein